MFPKNWGVRGKREVSVKRESVADSRQSRQTKTGVAWKNGDTYVYFA